MLFAFLLRVLTCAMLATGFLLPPESALARVQLRAPMAVITVEDLPAEARDTLRLIDHGGPYPFRRDGVEFGNREHLLPLRERGYYREYTVPTPGARDRGARRIITGRSGERFYTGDHYRSFRRIVP